MFTMRKSIIKNIYVLSVIFVNEFLFGDFVFLFAFTILFGDIQSTITIFCDIQRWCLLWSHATSSVEWGKMWACFNVWRVYLSRGSIVSVTEECFWFAYCKCVDVQFDWLCGIRRYVDVLPAFCSFVVSYCMVKESSDFVKKKKNYGWVELVVDH